jgi:hypothetical protein
MDFLLKHILVGSILGDGHLTPLNKKGESQLFLKYDDKTLSYLEWLHKMLSPIGVNRIKEKSKGGYHQHYFTTLPNRELGEFRKLFYPEGKKIVPENISKLLTDPIAISIWYMDDGSIDYRKNYHRNATFSTFCFSFKECECLQKAILKNFKIQVSIHKTKMRGKTYFRLYVKSESMDCFIDLIRKYIHPVFSYKALIG